MLPHCPLAVACVHEGGQQQGRTARMCLWTSFLTPEAAPVFTRGIRESSRWTQSSLFWCMGFAVHTGQIGMCICPAHPQWPSPPKPYSSASVRQLAGQPVGTCTCQAHLQKMRQQWEMKFIFLPFPDSDWNSSGSQQHGLQPRRKVIGMPLRNKNKAERKTSQRTGSSVGRMEKCHPCIPS